MRNPRRAARVPAVAGAIAAASLTSLAALAGAGSAAPTSPPVNVTRPAISGVAQEGRVLTGDPGRWRGSQPIEFAGQWKRCDAAGRNCDAIRGANGREYAVVRADVGHRIRVTVGARNRDGSASATSPPTDVVRAAPAAAPSSVAAPVISGAAQEGQTLVSTRGEWAGSQPMDLDLRWQRCDRNGLACANISGATSDRYVLTSADVGNRVRVAVIASNRAGRSTAFSRTTDVVSAKGPALPPGAIRLPDGSISIPVTSVALPQRLIVSSLEFSPNPLRSRDDLIRARFRIVDTRGYVVRGALVFAIPLPYGWTTQPPETVSGTDGWAEVQLRATPQLPKRAAIVMFVRARKPGDNVLAGVSTRRLVQMLVAIP